MKLRELRLGWRHLIEQPGYALVVVLGLAVGFGACMLLLAFVRFSLSYNAQVPDAQQVYVLKQRFNLDPRAPWFELAPVALMTRAMQDPAVQDASGIWQVTTRAVRIGAQVHKVELSYVLPHFASMLGVRALAGDLQAALDRPGGLALTQQTAQRWFGSQMALGRTVRIDGQLLTVTAIVPDPPANTTLPFSALVGMSSALVSANERSDLLKLSGSWGKVLLRLKRGSAPQALTDTLQQAIDHSELVAALAPAQRQQLGARSPMELRLTPLLDSYFDRDVAGAPFSGARGERAGTLGLAAVGALILLLATINTVNLATVHVLRRQREIAVRKLLGASARTVVLQFLAESVLVALLACALGLLLAWIVLPLFAQLVERQLDSVVSLANVGYGLTLALLVGLLAGLQPAWIALRVVPARALAGRDNAESARAARLRWCLTVLQFGAAVALAGLTLVIARQVQFAGQAYPGFDGASLLVIDSHRTGTPQGRAMRDAMARLPFVTGVAAAADAVGRHSSKGLAELGRAGRPSVGMQSKSVSANFFDVYQVRPLAGRLFEAGRDDAAAARSVVLNVVAARALGFAAPQDAVGQTVLSLRRDGSSSAREVIGIAPELRHESLHEAPVPTAYFPSDDVAVLTLRVNGEMADVERAVQAQWRASFPDEELSMHRADSFFALDYADDARLASLLAAATAVALTIAGFGIYVLAAYGVRRKQREIVMRKLYGALPRDIATLVLRDCLRVLGAGALLGVPLALFGAQRYLAGFVERDPLGLWMVPLAGVGAGALALLASARQSVLAARSTPLLALRAD